MTERVGREFDKHVHVDQNATAGPTTAWSRAPGTSTSTSTRTALDLPLHGVGLRVTKSKPKATDSAATLAETRETYNLLRFRLSHLSRCFLGLSQNQASALFAPFGVATSSSGP